MFLYLTNDPSEYKNINSLPVYELWRLGNRVGYVLYDFEGYIDNNGAVQTRNAFIWKFIGFGRSCFAETEKDLKEKVLALISSYNNAPKKYGYSTYPYYIRHYRWGVETMKNFIAFDFETANQHRHSICSVGMVFVRMEKL